MTNLLCRLKYLRNHNTQFIFKILILIAITFFFTTSVYAITMWESGDGDWGDSTHWSNGVPTSTEDAHISVNTPTTVTITNDANADEELISSATVVQSAGAHIANSLYLLNMTNGIAPSYTLNGGTLSADVTIENGVFTQNGGSASSVGISLKSGEFNLTGGTLTCQSLALENQNSSVFNQTGGTSVLTNFSDNGVYNFAAGNLAISEAAGIGGGGTGVFTQKTGTSLRVGRSVSLGSYGWGAGKGTYNLNGGHLEILNGLKVGENESGDFYQNGGSNTVGSIMIVGGSYIYSSNWLQPDSLAKGFYRLKDDGNLTVNGSEYLGFRGGDGSFLQESGTHEITGDLSIAYDFQHEYDSYGNIIAATPSKGAYTLDGGTLSAANIFMGTGGMAYVTQNGGTVTGMYNPSEPYTSGNIHVGPYDDTGGRGTYYLNDGVINAAHLDVMRGSFYQSGGTVNISNAMTTDFNGFSEYSMTGGTLNAQYIYNKGGLQFNQGTSINVDTLFTYAGGVLVGDGTIHGNVNNEGSIYIGENMGDEATSTLIIDGNLSALETETFRNRQFAFDLGGYTQGVDYDFLHILDRAYIDGVLFIDLSSGFDPLSGSVFNLITADNGLSGTFRDFYLPEFSDGRYWEIGYDDNNVFLSILGGQTPPPDPVPEPATILLLGSGLAGLAFYRRKRK